MKLHEDGKLFREAILATAQEKNMAEIYVEKDYWVTITLFKIFTSRAAGLYANGWESNIIK